MTEQNPPSALAVRLPEYDECADAVRAKTATLLQLFISEYEPWDNDEEWGEMLTKTINEALITARAEWEATEAERIAAAWRKGRETGLREALTLCRRVANNENPAGYNDGGQSAHGASPPSSPIRRSRHEQGDPEY